MAQLLLHNLWLSQVCNLLSGQSQFKCFFCLKPKVFVGRREFIPGVFSYRGKGRKEEKEKAEASVQHIYGSHKVDNTEVNLITSFLNCSSLC